MGDLATTGAAGLACAGGNLGATLTDAGAAVFLAIAIAGATASFSARAPFSFNWFRNGSSNADAALGASWAFGVTFGAAFWA